MSSGERLGWLERAGDRLNPILVKEVRQALRGRYFRISFWFTLLAASVASLGYLVFQADQMGDAVERPLGVAFYSINFACIAIATHGLVPFSAFVAMGSEWDEHTWDLLVLSNLKPRQIVVGKVLSSGVQALLFYSAFGPFLVFAFLLRGIDLTALLVTLVGSMVLSFALCCFAVALSSLTQQRFARIALMGLLAAFLITVVTLPSITAATYLVRFPGQLHEPEALFSVIGLLALLGAAGVFFVLIGAARLAHPEENRSTALRVYAVALALGFLALAAVTATRLFGVSGDDSLGLALLAQVFLAAAGLFFATEPERLGRRAARQVPRRRTLALLAAPFLPGGGRGLLWYVLANAAIALWVATVVLIASARDPAFSGPSAAQWMVLPVATAFGLVYIGVPSLVFASGSAKPRVRVGARITAAFLFMASVVVPAIAGFFLRRHDWMDFQHRANPAHVLWSLLSGEERAIAFAPEVAVALGLVVLMANVPRLSENLREVERASRARASLPPAPRHVPLEEQGAI